MKKFMTVLLVVAVMFTFSFGSAFAAPSVDEQITAKVLEEQAAMAKFVNEMAGKFVYDQNGMLKLLADGVSAGDNNLSKEVIDYAIAQVIVDYNKAIQEVGIAKQAAGVYDDAVAAAIAAAWAPVDDAAAFVTAFGTYLADEGVVYKKALEIAKADATAYLDGVDTSVYAEADAASLKTLIQTARTAAATTANTAASLDALVDAVAAVKAFVGNTSNLTAAEQVAKVEELKAEAIAAVVKAADAYVEARTTALEAIISNPASTTDAVIAAQAELATLAADAANVVALYEGRINEVEITKDFTFTQAQTRISTIQGQGTGKFVNKAAFDGIVGKLAGVELLEKYATELANGYKNAYDENPASTTYGMPLYNAATVDAGLAEVAALIKDLQLTTYAAVKAEMETIPQAAAEKTALQSAIAAGKSQITTGTYALTLWTADTDNYDAVKAIQKDYTAQIEAATSADAIKALVKEAREAMDAYLKTAEIATLEGRVDSLVMAAAPALGYEAKFIAYRDGFIASNADKVFEEATKTAAITQAKKVIYDAVVATQDAELTDTEIKAIAASNYSAALAKIEEMQTKDVLEAGAKEVIDAIAALPTTATLEAKADYLAVKEMVKEYKALAGAKTITNEPVLNNYLAKIERLDKEAVEALVKALPGKNAVTIADQAAVEAAVAANEAFEEEYTAEITALYKTKLTEVKAALDGALKLNAAQKIIALPAVITAADQAAVEAARAAYDALDEDAKEAFDTASKALVEKLEAAEDVLATLNVYTDADAQAYVQDLSIKARSVKTEKGNVKVTIVADVEELIANGYSVEYKFYRSEKARAKYGTAKKVSEDNVYTNTAGKKGVQYFYKAKLVVKNAEGEVVATTPLTQCKYATRVWSK